METETAKEQRLLVGGSKGHISESIEGPILALFQAFRWKMIPRCTGRYTCRNHDAVSTLTPLQLLQEAEIDASTFPSYEFSLPNKDPILVVAMDPHHSTGIISYIKGDSDSGEIRFVHTLNTSSGFQRKLQAMGLTVTSSDVRYKATEPMESSS